MFVRGFLVVVIKSAVIKNIFCLKNTFDFLPSLFCMMFIEGIGRRRTGVLPTAAAACLSFFLFSFSTSFIHPRFDFYLSSWTAAAVWKMLPHTFNVVHSWESTYCLQKYVPSYYVPFNLLIIGSSGVGSDRSVNCATMTAQLKALSVPFLNNSVKVL